MQGMPVDDVTELKKKVVTYFLNAAELTKKID